MFNKVFTAALKYVEKLEEEKPDPYDTHEFQRHLTRVISGVRGPDGDAGDKHPFETSYEIKKELTCPIRCWFFDREPNMLFLDFGFNAGSRFPETEEAMDQYFKRIRYWQTTLREVEGTVQSFTHYFEHCTLAMRSIQYLELWYAEGAHESTSVLPPDAH